MAKYKPSKNKKKHIVKKMQETEGLNAGFGEFQENTGGGHPFEAGNSNTRTTKENGKLRKAENPKTNQPRTEDGKFTYKSVNGKSIDPKYGPSRGVTVPPTLTGGENGIKIEDVEEQFTKQSGAHWDKYKNKWYRKGGKVVTEGLSTKVSGMDVWNQAKEYNEELGQYDSIVGQIFAGKGEQENWKTKTGRKSAAEKEAQQKAKEEKSQQNVINKETGAIEQVGGAKLKSKEPKVSSGEEPKQKLDEKFGSGKYTRDQVQEAINVFAGAGIDISGLPEEAIEKLIDENIEF